MPTPRSIPARPTPPTETQVLGAETAAADPALKDLFSDSMRMYRYPQNFDWDTGRWIAFRLVYPEVGLYKEEDGHKIPHHLAAVVTHMPAESLKTSYNVTYEDKDLGAGGPIAQQVFDGSKKFKESTSAGVRNLIDNVYATARAKLQEALFAHEFEEAFDVGMRKNVNQFTQNVFSGVRFRQHSFTLMFTGKNPQESAAIDNIIQVFKLGMLPGYKSWAASDQDLFFGFPYEWEISFHPDYERTTFKILRSVLTDLDVDYAPHGPVAFHKKDALSGGYRPVSIAVKLQFKEMVLLTRDMHVAFFDSEHHFSTDRDGAPGFTPFDATGGVRNIRPQEGGRVYRF